MKLIIAGGRDYDLGPKEWEWLNELAKSLPSPIDEVVQGGATGADWGGEEWALDQDIGVRTFKPDWTKNGKAAGPIRNREMAEYATPDGAVALFPGGRGTASMRREAERAGLRIFEYTPAPAAT